MRTSCYELGAFIQTTYLNLLRWIEYIIIASFTNSEAIYSALGSF